METDPQPAVGTRQSREIFGVFDSAAAFENAATDLLVAGYDQRRLSVLAKDNTIEDKLGDRFERTETFRDGDDVERTAFVEKVTKNETKAMALGALGYVGAVAAAGSVVVSGGTTLAAGLAAVVAGGGSAAAGEALNRLLGERFATSLQEQLDHGGIALWVAIDGESEDIEVRRILSNNGAAEVVAHQIDLSTVAHDNPLSGTTVDPLLKGAKI